jgi:hypothetical protein
MTMANLYTVDQLPTTSQAAIREFDDRYIAAQGAFSPSKWFDLLGAFESVNTPYTTFPINQLSLQFQETKGESRFKQALEKYIDVKSVEFDEGIEAKLLDLFTQAFSWKRWQQGPQLLTIAEERFRAKKIATLIEAGETTLTYDGKYFFDDDHPVNPGDSSLGTWDNLQASTKDVVSLVNIEAEITLFRQNCKDENGEKIDVNSFAICVPTEKYESVKNLLKKEMVAGSGTESESNPYAGDGSIEVIHMPQLTDANDWYIVAKDLIAMCPPWLALKLNVPGSLAARTFDESSDFFRNTGKIKYSAHIWYGFNLAFPHAMRKIVGA